VEPVLETVDIDAEEEVEGTQILDGELRLEPCFEIL
jgi:hypothetical protein